MASYPSTDSPFIHELLKLCRESGTPEELVLQACRAPSAELPPKEAPSHLNLGLSQMRTAALPDGWSLPSEAVACDAFVASRALSTTTLGANHGWQFIGAYSLSINGSTDPPMYMGSIHSTVDFEEYGPALWARGWVLVTRRVKTPALGTIPWHFCALKGNVMHTFVPVPEDQTPQEPEDFVLSFLLTYFASSMQLGDAIVNADSYPLYRFATVRLLDGLKPTMVCGAPDWKFEMFLRHDGTILQKMTRALD